MNRNELDEMQLQKRNKVGNQAFMLLFYLLLFDVGIYGFGIRWLNYPANVLVIMMTSMLYYLIRIIWNNAYIGPKIESSSAGKRAVYIAATAGFTAAVTIFISRRNFIKTQAANSGDNGAMVLFIVSIVCILIAVLISIISKKQNGNGNE